MHGCKVKGVCGWSIPTSEHNASEMSDQKWPKRNKMPVICHTEAFH